METANQTETAKQRRPYVTGLAHEAIRLSRRRGTFKTIDVLDWIYGRRDVHPQQRDRVSKLLNRYVEANLLYRLGRGSFAERIPQPGDGKDDLRTLLDAQREVAADRLSRKGQLVRLVSDPVR